MIGDGGPRLECMKLRLWGMQLQFLTRSQDNSGDKKEARLLEGSSRNWRPDYWKDHPVREFIFLYQICKCFHWMKSSSIFIIRVKIPYFKKSTVKLARITCFRCLPTFLLVLFLFDSSYALYIKDITSILYVGVFLLLHLCLSFLCLILLYM